MSISEWLPVDASAIGVSSICKSFGATNALTGATFQVAKGSVHALLGENGAGKSTLIKIISGLLQPNSGSISVAGKTVVLPSRQVALSHGIATAFQELTLVKDLSVTKNLLMPYEPRNALGQLKRRAAEELVSAHLAKLRIKGVSPRAEVGQLSLPQRQKLEIARAVMGGPKVLLLDEPTSALSGPDIDWLGDVIAEQKAAGTALIFISHRLSEVRQYCDEITILRNGRSVGTFANDDIEDEKVIELIIGRSLDTMFPSKPQRAATTKQPLLSVQNLKAGKAVDLSLSIGEGEIVGVAALQGMGQLDLFRALSGDIAAEEGIIQIGGRNVVFTCPSDAIESNIGVSFLPEERKTEALFLKLDGRFNSTLPILDRFSSFGIPNTKLEEQIVARAFDNVQVSKRAMHSPMSNFSGGNQQKVVMAKWFLADSKLMLLFDPTRGVDVGTKYEIYVLLQQYAQRGGGILFYSTEIDELLHLCDKIIVMYGGRIVKTIEYDGEPIPEKEVMRAALGANTA